MIDDEIFKGTPSLWKLIVSKNPDDNNYTHKDYDNYKKINVKN